MLFKGITESRKVPTVCYSKFLCWESTRPKLTEYNLLFLHVYLLSYLIFGMIYGKKMFRINNVKNSRIFVEPLKGSMMTGKWLTENIWLWSHIKHFNDVF